MEVAGIVLAGAGLAPIFLQTARSLRNAAKSIKYARRELEDLTNEMIIFNGFYGQFLQVCSEKMKGDKRASSARKRLISWAEKAKLDFQKLSRHVDALAIQPMQPHSTKEILTAHLKWYQKKSTLEYLRASLIVARQSMVGFTNLCEIKRLDEQLAELKSILTPHQKSEIEKKFGMAVEDLIQSIQKQIDEQHMELEFGKEFAQEFIVKVSSKQSQSEDFDSTMHTKRLLHFSSMVDRHIEHVLPSDQSSKRKSRSMIPNRGPRPHSFTSQSSGTMYTRSSQSSHRHPAAAPPPESPPTSPEPFSDTSSDRKVPSSTFISCRKCRGTCIHSELHAATMPNPVQRTPHTTDAVAATRPITGHSDQDEYMDLMLRRKALKKEWARPKRTFDLDEYLDILRRQRAIEEKYSLVSSRPVNDHLTPDVPPSPNTEPPEAMERLANAANAQRSRNDITIAEKHNQDEENPAYRVGDGEEAMSEREATDDADEDQDETTQEDHQHETTPSKWQPLSAFHGREPRNLRARRERSSSPQQHWSSKPWEEEK